MSFLRPIMRSVAAVLVFAPSVAVGTAVAQLPFGVHLTDGANSRGYVGPSVPSGQIFTAECATTGFLGGFDIATQKVFDPGNKTISEGTGCFHPGWTGTSVMESAPGVLKSYTSTAVTDPTQLGDTYRIIALSRVAYLDKVFLSSMGAIPDSVRFGFNLDGTVTGASGVNGGPIHTVDFGMQWDTDVPPTLTQGEVDPSGAYFFAFAVDASMLDRWVPFAISLQTFAIVAAMDATMPFEGSATSDYSHTLTVTGVDYLKAIGAGPGADITADVDAIYLSGATYLTATPEPATMLLMASGLIPVVGFANRRRRRL